MDIQLIQVAHSTRLPSNFMGNSIALCQKFKLIFFVHIRYLPREAWATRASCCACSTRPCWTLRPPPRSTWPWWPGRRQRSTPRRAGSESQSTSGTPTTTRLNLAKTGQSSGNPEWLSQNLKNCQSEMFVCFAKQNHQCALCNSSNCNFPNLQIADSAARWYQKVPNWYLFDGHGAENFGKGTSTFLALFQSPKF